MKDEKGREFEPSGVKGVRVWSTYILEARGKTGQTDDHEGKIKPKRHMVKLKHEAR